jgi:hypothetical protein
MTAKRYDLMTPKAYEGQRCCLLQAASCPLSFPMLYAFPHPPFCFSLDKTNIIYGSVTLLRC